MPVTLSGVEGHLSSGKTQIRFINYILVAALPLKNNISTQTRACGIPCTYTPSKHHQSLQGVEIPVLQCC